MYLAECMATGKRKRCPSLQRVGGKVSITSAWPLKKVNLFHVHFSPPFYSSYSFFPIPQASSLFIFFLCFKFLKFVCHHHYHTIIITIIIISATMKPARIYDLSYFLQPPWGEIPLGPLKGILGLGQMKQLAQGYQAEK